MLGSAKAVSVVLGCMPSLGDRKKAFIASTRLLANCMRLGATHTARSQWALAWWWRPNTLSAPCRH